MVTERVFVDGIDRTDEIVKNIEEGRVISVFDYINQVLPFAFDKLMKYNYFYRGTLFYSSF